MNYKKIRLENERNSHVEKRLNRLNTWNFFRVLYRENVWRLFGFSLLMLLLIVPILVMFFLINNKSDALQSSLPMLGGLGFTTGIWDGVGDYFNQQNAIIQFQGGLITVAVSLVVALMFSGGFAVIRDSFWTGKLSKVGVFKSMWMGFKANLLYALVSVLIISSSVFGIFIFGSWLLVNIAKWLAIVIIVLLGILAFMIALYLLTLCSVTVTYKQSVATSMRDAWLLMWLNIVPNIIHLILALLPIGMYLLFTGFLQMMVTVLIFMFGGMYFPLVWHSHMMRTFALFHPVEVKKKGKQKQSKQLSPDEVGGDSWEQPQPKQQANKQSKSQQKAETAGEQPTTETPSTDETN